MLVYQRGTIDIFPWKSSKPANLPSGPFVSFCGVLSFKIFKRWGLFEPSPPQVMDSNKDNGISEQDTTFWSFFFWLLKLRNCPTWRRGIQSHPRATSEIVSPINFQNVTWLLAFPFPTLFFHHIIIFPPAKNTNHFLGRSITVINHATTTPASKTRDFQPTQVDPIRATNKWIP